LAGIASSLESVGGLWQNHFGCDYAHAHLLLHHHKTLYAWHARIQLTRQCKSGCELLIMRLAALSVCIHYADSLPSAQLKSADRQPAKHVASNGKFAIHGFEQELSQWHFCLSYTPQQPLILGFVIQQDDWCTSERAFSNAIGAQSHPQWLCAKLASTVERFNNHCCDSA